MKKKKGIEKEIKFNPADYSYLDNIHPSRWIWEFERRFEQYRKAYVFRQNNPSKINPHEKGLIFFRSQHWDPRLKANEIPIEIMPVFSKANPLNVINLKWGRYSRLLKIEGEPSPYTTRPHSILEGQEENENVIMALIDLSAPGSTEHLLKGIEKEIRRWRKLLRLPKRRQPKKIKINSKTSRIWKSYLIVYDLHKKTGCFERTCNILSPLFQEKLYEDVKTVERHYKEAEKMINGGYKEFS